MPDDQGFESEGTLVLEQRFAIVPEWIINAQISDCAFRLYAVLLRYGQTSGQRMPGRALLAKRAFAGPRRRARCRRRAGSDRRLADPAGPSAPAGAVGCRAGGGARQRPRGPLHPGGIGGPGARAQRAHPLAPADTDAGETHPPVDARLRLLSRVAEQVGEGVVLIDADGWLIYANPAFATMHGHGSLDLAGEHFTRSTRRTGNRRPSPL